MRNAAILGLLVASLAVGQSRFIEIVWTWSQGDGGTATGFHVQRAETHGGPYTVIGTVSVSTLAYTDTTLEPGKNYFFIVTAFDEFGDGPVGNELWVSTPYVAPAAPAGLATTAQEIQ